MPLCKLMLKIMIDEIIYDLNVPYGICPFDLVKDNLINCRAKEKLPQNSKSIIVFLFPYKFEDNKYVNSNISKYACVKDYHIVINDALSPVIDRLKTKFPENKFVSFSDNSPIPEVTAAVYAGLGVKGKNNLLINSFFGSYVFIGEIVTDLELEYNEFNLKSCINCGACIAECPKQAISENGINKDKCLSNIIQSKGEISEQDILLIKDNNCLWGCDICQDICPMNTEIKINPFNGFLNGFENRLRCDGDISDRAYAWRGNKIVKRNYDIERMK